MNILFFLKPKGDITYIRDDQTLRNAMEIMERDRYSAIPIVSKEGTYVGTLSEGDILWYFKSLKEFDLKKSEKTYIRDIKRYRDYKPIRIDMDMIELVEISKHESFIPVLDDRNMFIGIITRQDIITYFYDQLK